MLASSNDCCEFGAGRNLMDRLLFEGEKRNAQQPVGDHRSEKFKDREKYSNVRRGGLQYI